MPKTHILVKSMHGPNALSCVTCTGDRPNTLDSFYLHSQRPLLLIIRRTDERLINKLHRQLAAKHTAHS